MDNPSNRLITREEVENILNHFTNIGNDKIFLHINNLEHYQRAFVHESYFQAIQNTVLNQSEMDKIDNIIEKETTKNQEKYINYVPIESNERLEYLGDHILKAILGRYLYMRFGDQREGFLTRLKIKLERCSMLHQVGVVLGFKKHLLLSLQVENQTILDIDRGRNTPSYYEDAFESFIGAIMEDFQEMGYVYAERFVISVIENTVDFAEIISKNDNFKDSLQRFFQSHKWKTPNYYNLQESGPLYRKVFTRMLFLTQEQFDDLNPEQQNSIKEYSYTAIEEYKNTNPDVFEKLMELITVKQYILGIGFGRKVVQAEQDCAKTSLLNLQLDLNY